MKTKITHQQVTRIVFIGLCMLGVVGGVCWVLLIPGRPTTTLSSPPVFLTLPNGASVTSIVLLPGSRNLPISLPIARSALVAGAEDATSRAVVAANDAASRDYGVEPFADAKATATFDGRHWSWRKRVGHGRGDLEAEVKIAPGGTVESITIRYTTQQFAQRF